MIEVPTTAASPVTVALWYLGVMPVIFIEPKGISEVGVSAGWQLVKDMTAAAKSPEKM
jgi:hypothetical protein